MLCEQYMQVSTAKMDVPLTLNYRQISNISGTNSQNLNVSHRVLQLSLYKILKPGAKSRMKM